MTEVTKKARTAFTVVQEENGSYQVLSDVNQKIEIDHKPTLLDIRLACGELQHAILRNEAINAVMAVLAQNNDKTEPVATDSEEVSTPEVQ